VELNGRPYKNYIVAGGDGAVLFEPGKEILDQMPRFV
jgi:hypothetical protein